MTAPLIKRVLLIWLVICAFLIATHFRSIAGWQFPDQDDALRLLEVRDFLSGQNWFDVHQYRVAAPQGVAMHWSRLVDLPLAGMIVLLKPLLGTALAEAVTVVAVPLLTLLCALLLIGRLAGQLLDVEAAGFACLFSGLAAPAIAQLQPMRIDHHGWQIVLALVALNGLAMRDPRKGGWTIGLAMAASLAISLEGLPLTAVFCAVCALRFLRDPGEGYHGGRGWLVHTVGALAVGSIGFFLATRGTFDPVNHCDTVSPVHLAVFAWGAAGCLGIAAMGRRRLPLVLAAMALIATGAIAIMLLSAPQCAGGAFAELDPVVRKYWYNHVREGMPVWQMPPAVAAAMIVLPLLGLIGAAYQWWSAKDGEARLLWLDITLVLAGSAVIAMLVSRAAGTACLLGAAPAGALVRDLLNRSRTVRQPLRRIAALLGIGTLLYPSLPVLAWTLATQQTGIGHTAEIMPKACDYHAAAAALNALPATDIFAPVDIGPYLLVDTHHRVVATGHHRGSAGMHDVIVAFLGSDDQARAIVHQRHATLVMICPSMGEPMVYAQIAPNGWMAHLVAGHPPAWLQPLPIAPESKLKLWKVVG
ncbi:hypothetical protein [Novosphingobium lentum]|uniref:hypothetical protein n=1 Tax=Novosphingobium lentum TaxID=145287 RepID=UPI000B26CB38|nr:hypothetical protein [Novosphingobium lentum]